jgi:hypothetical protein
MEERQVALPKLYGAPGYYRPPRQVDESPKPFDPDELPIAAARTDDEARFVEDLPSQAFAPGGGVILEPRTQRNGHDGGHDEPKRGLRGLAGRLLGGD